MGLNSARADLTLSDGWRLQASGQVAASGQTVSLPGFAVETWLPTRVPATVLAAWVSHHSEIDPFYAQNLLSLPPSAGFFDQPWWYRVEFDTADLSPGNLSSGAEVLREVSLEFKGITYGADIWLNGHKIASHDENLGTYRTPRYEIGAYLKPASATNRAEKNVLAILVWPPQDLDLTASWVDWNPTPSDRNMGLWRDVILHPHGSVRLAHAMVATHLPQRVSVGATGAAELTIAVDATNSSDKPVSGRLIAFVSNASATDAASVTVQKPITLQPAESRAIEWTSAEFAQLRISNARLWWPKAMGRANLAKLQVQFVADGQTQADDSQSIMFGMREITSELTSTQARLFSINGWPMQIRGGGWSSDLFLRFSPERLRKELDLAQDLGLNTIRLEGRFEPESFLSEADRRGILIMPGWVCCNAWQKISEWDTYAGGRNFKIAADSLRDQINEFRSHASVFVFLYGSDQAPTARVEESYYKVFKERHWPNPVLSSAADTTTSLNGRSGLKMNGPYDYVPPSYWYVDQNQAGGAWGFCAETSPGPSIPRLESLREFIRPDHLWPVSGDWSFHAGLNEFHSIDLFTNAMKLRYGPSSTLEDFVKKAQVMGYDGHRAMFEAFAKNKYRTATGVIQWMLNNSWPSVIWHLYDHSLRPSGAYYAVKKSNEPLHAQYSYDDQSIYVVNNTYAPFENVNLVTTEFDAQMNVIFFDKRVLNVQGDTSMRALALPNALTVASASNLYYVKLELRAADGRELSQNFYWLSKIHETFDWANTDFYHTPVVQEGDLTELQKLPTVALEVKWATTPSTDDLITGVVHLKNASQQLSFFNHFRLLTADGRELLPVEWSDNDVSLVSGETRELTFRYHVSTGVGQLQNRRMTKSRMATSSALKVEVSGWNTNTALVPSAP